MNASPKRGATGCQYKKLKVFMAPLP